MKTYSASTLKVALWLQYYIQTKHRIKVSSLELSAPFWFSFSLPTTFYPFSPLMCPPTCCCSSSSVHACAICECVRGSLAGLHASERCLGLILGYSWRGRKGGRAGLLHRVNIVLKEAWTAWRQSTRHSVGTNLSQGGQQFFHCINRTCFGFRKKMTCASFCKCQPMDTASTDYPLERGTGTAADDSLHMPIFIRSYAPLRI